MIPFIRHLLPKRLTRWLQRLWWALACLVLLLGAVPALAQGPAAALQPTDLILDRAYWRDHTGQASLAQAQQHHYTPFRQGFSGGYTDAVHWLRLKLAASDTPISLRLLPPWIDEITLYDPASPDTTYRAGDRHPKSVNAQHVLGYAFNLPAHPQPREVWLQLRSTSAHQLTLQALSAGQLPAANTRAIVWTALYAAVLLLMLLALLSIWWVQRDAVLTAYLVRHTNYILYGVTYLGLTDLLLDQVLPPGWLDRGFSLLVVMTLPLGLWFDITLLKTYKPHPLLIKALQLLAWASLGLVPLLLAGHARLALQTTVMALALAVPLVFATAWSAQPEAAVERLMSKRVLLGYYALILSSLLIGLSGLLGWGALQGLTPYLLTLHGLLSGLVMTMILFVLGQRQHQLTQHMRWQLQKAQQEVELEQRRREEQSQFLHMLMHELKTPLSVVSLALGTRGNREENLQHASRAVQDMKAIIDRCVEADQLGQLTLERHPEPLDAAQLIHQLADQIPDLRTRFVLQAPKSIPQLLTDRQLLHIVLINLLDNARRYSDPLTPVTVTLHPQPDHGIQGLRICVSNTPGLAGWPDAQQLFSKYYRASGAQTESGSGLGLYLAQQLVQTLGGTLRYTPTLQRVEFVLWLPLSPN
ncbi:ATP-binding protein [Limnohabitans sp.]|uniref:sensor histidine kinase n=1 Tax=Limnohabitans sp. TaxID=1907725 RepID=UPI0031FD3234